VPRNHRAIDKDERIERLLNAAAEQFLTVGYPGTTMAQIARGAGVTSAAVYWYFPSKDDALVAVQRRVLGTTRDMLAREDLEPMRRLQRYLEILRAEARPLHRMLHERSPHSDAVAEVLTEIHDELEEMIRAAVAARSASFGDLQQIVDLSMAVIEGTSAVSAEVHSADLVKWAIERLVPGQIPPKRTAAPRRSPARS
jgi:AcrR family transcriptional regulator